jgi:gentisate 1,2-dioxygenase
LHWKWSEVRPCLEEAIHLVSPQDVERRVLTLRDPQSSRLQQTTTPALTAAFQVLLPGEVARSHRHSIDAIRFVIEGQGAMTRVDGKDCPMLPGDLIITPSLSWHEHHHQGNHVVVWLDVLNGPLHRFFGTATFEAGPPNDQPASNSEEAYSIMGFMPEIVTGYCSSMFRYPFDQACSALQHVPVSESGEQRIRYVNPQTGENVLILMSVTLIGLHPLGRGSNRFTNASTICHVVEGSGRTQIGEEVIEWSAKDVFTIPAGNFSRHLANAAQCKILEISDSPVLKRLGLLQESNSTTLESRSEGFLT